jgi:hypothetical protein
VSLGGTDSLDGGFQLLDVAPYADFEGVQTNANWFIDKEFAELWQAYAYGDGRIFNTPIAEYQAVSVDRGDSVAITLVGSDPEGDDVIFAVETGPTNGTLSGVAPNLTYMPGVGYTGLDSFTFTANDGVYTSSLATVWITVNEKVNEVIAAWDFDAATEVAETEDPNVSTVFSVGAGGTLSSSAAIGAGDTSGGAVAPYDALWLTRGNGWDANNFAEAKANKDYFEFTITPENGVAVNFAELLFSAAIRDENTSPEVWMLTSSLDGHTSAIASGTISTLLVKSSTDNTEVAGDFQDFSVDLSGVDFQNRTNGTTFRFYICNEDSTDNSTAASTRYDRFIFMGNVSQVSTTPYEQWMKTAFTNATTGTDQTLTGNPDGDPLNNRFEWALGTDPLVADQPALECSVRSGNFRVTYKRRNSAVTGIDVYASWKASLTNEIWRVDGDGMTESSMGWSNEVETVAVLLPMNNTNGFIRIEANEQ